MWSERELTPSPLLLTLKLEEGGHEPGKVASRNWEEASVFSLQDNGGLGPTTQTNWILPATNEQERYPPFRHFPDSYMEGTHHLFLSSVVPLKYSMSATVFPKLFPLVSSPLRVLPCQERRFLEWPEGKQWHFGHRAPHTSCLSLFKYALLQSSGSESTGPRWPGVWGHWEGWRGKEGT